MMTKTVKEVQIILDRELQKRLLELKHNIAIINCRMEKYPEGVLEIKTVNGKFYYCIADTKDKKIKYVRKDHIDVVRCIAQRDYDQSYLKIGEKEISDIENYLSQNYSNKTQECYSNLHAGRKSLVQPLELSDEEYIEKWMSASYIPKEFKESDSTHYYTEKGERVRSKSEVIIANVLNALSIPYKYECPLKLGQVTIYPDFTILDVKRRKEKYVEHFGMMGDSDYVSNMLYKMNLYEQNNIYMGDRLICSFESSKRTLDIYTLKNKLNALLFGE
ncbi:MAG: hypothetical protein MJ133_11955 [Lachnospiraceae bacterium]|nr:hypothetical protein [Lachnospiraceae bacterium]